MNRRSVIKNLGLATTSSILFQKNSDSLDLENFLIPDRSNNKLKGFIVSDAHFGWIHQDQPTPEMQKKMMERIINRFTDLDVFIDTGDAHHSGLGRKPGDDARGNWTDIIAGGCSTTPFYYIAGNHEIIGTLNDDPEWRCNAMGSVSCRPYYSFDIKGIHFISLPELIQPIYINKESIEWLTLDLEINKDKTVILLSHNSIKGTTCLMGEIGYRGLVNSMELLNLFKLYPNVISWMNGHNHTYEVVEKEGMLHVSNGRIGGFIPPKLWGRMGQGHLGGIYFEISSDSLLVRGYSATEEKFFDEMGDNQLSGLLGIRTTLDPFAKPSYSFGAGGMSNGQMIPAFNHHLTEGSRAELFFKSSEAPSINDDPDFSLFEFRNAGKLGNQWLLMGASVGTPKYFEMENNLWEWRNPGIRLLRQGNPDTFIDVNIPAWQFSKNCYYRGVPGKRYKVIIDLYALNGGQKLETELNCYDNLGNELKKIIGANWILDQGGKRITSVFDIPEFSEAETIYGNNTKDKMIQVSVKARFTKMGNDIFLNKFSLLEDADNQIMINPEVIINGKSFSNRQQLKHGDIGHFLVNAPQESRIVIQTKFKSSLGLTWLYRQNNIEWQVRNATVSDKGSFFEIGALRNTWSLLEEIIIVPFHLKNEPFIHRLRNIYKAKIYPLNRNNKLLKIEVDESAEIGEVQVFSFKKPSEIRGSADWSFENQITTIKVKNNSQIYIVV